MARFCGKCGSAANDQATFCNKCGERLLQRKAIRFGQHETTPPAPANPYQGQTPSESTALPSGPVGVQRAVRKPGRKVSPPQPPTRSAEPQVSASASRPEGYEVSLRPQAPESQRPVLAALDEDPVVRAHSLVRNFSLWSAGIVLIPLPLTHLALLVPVQSAMVLKIARIFGVEDPPEKILAYIAATSGISVFGQVTSLIISSLFPVVGGLVSAPFIYGWTYGLGEVAIQYFQTQGQISPEEMKSVFKQASTTAKKTYGKEKKLSKDESLEALRDQMDPEEYDRLRQKFGSEQG